MRALIRLLVLPLVAAAALGASGPARKVVGWDFDTDLEGWTANHEVKDVTVRDGVLSARTIGSDPILKKEGLQIRARGQQWIEVRMKCSPGGSMKIFWANTTKPPYGGFRSGKFVSMNVRGDGQWHTYRVFPCWQGEDTILKLRLDPFGGANMQIDYVRIMEPRRTKPARSTSAWTFDGGDTEGWMPARGIRSLGARDGLLQVRSEADGMILDPALETPTRDKRWVCMRLKTDRAKFADLRWATRDTTGLHRKSLPLRPDGRFHTYAVCVAGEKSWRGTLVALGLTPSLTNSARVTVDWMRITADPAGDADPRKVQFGLQKAVNRTGARCPLVFRATNQGGEPARNLTATLQVDSDAVNIISSSRVSARRDLHWGETATLQWTLRAEDAGAVPARVSVSADGMETRSYSTTLHFSEPPDVAETDYVPEPQPVESPCEIAAYYFPGWKCPASWAAIRAVAPERRPALGWYDEADPEVVDWQIKWAAEHGIDVFLVDWYWRGGDRLLEHWLEAYKKARYREHLKIALMWANHPPFNVQSREDWRETVQYWIDNYFSLDTYYRIDGKPAVYMWKPRNVRDNIGGSAKAKDLYEMADKMAREAGLDGVTFVAVHDHQDERSAERIYREGYRYATNYHWWGAAPPRHFPYSRVTQRSRPDWEEHAAFIDGLGFLPIVDTGWDSRPWHGPSARVCYGRSVDLWEKLLRDAKQYVEETDGKRLVVGPLNEWGEGSYIEPCTEYGFAMYDALRRVFCREGDYPPNLVPSDVGLGPYGVAQQSEKRRWDFEDGRADRWCMKTTTEACRLRGGTLVMPGGPLRSSLHSPPLGLRARAYRAVRVRMKVSPAAKSRGRLRLTWKLATGHSFSDAVRLQSGEGFHTYTLDVGEHPLWLGSVCYLELRPGAPDDADIIIDSIELLPR